MRSNSFLRAPQAPFFLLLGLLTGTASAQMPENELKPKNFSLIDTRGVDVAERTFHVVHSITIGVKEHGGMSYSAFSQSGAGASGSIWRFYGSVMAYVRHDKITDPDTLFEYDTWSLNYMGNTVLMEFTGNGNEYIGENGERMVLCNGPSYCVLSATLNDGTALTFETTPTSVISPPNGPHTGDIFQVTSATKPDGERLEWHYLPGGLAIRSITNNYGYQLRFGFASSNPQGGVLTPPTSATLFNMAYDPCNPDALTCPAFSRAWPKLTFELGTGGVVNAVVEPGGGRTVYTYTGPQKVITKVDGPGTRDVDITYQDCGPEPPNSLCAPGTGFENVGNMRVSSVKIGGRTWSYAFEPTATGPAGHKVKVTSAVGVQHFVSLVDSGRGNPFGVIFSPASAIVYMRDELSRVTTVNYVGFLHPQPSKITYPEGNYDSYSYDARGNVIEVRNVAKSGSGLADRVTTIVRGEGPTINPCVQPASCNRAFTMRDPRGTVTRNTWNLTTGLLMSTEVGLTGPDGSLACGLGANMCPKTTYGYSSLNAWFFNASGTMAAGSAISKLTTTSVCALVANCTGSAQIVTTLNYGSPGLANNLLVRSSAVGPAGTTHTTSFTYDAFGNLTQVDGPRIGVSDITRYTWDALRRPVDDINTDNSATHKTYTVEGYVASEATGVVDGSGTFTPTLTTSFTYDSGGLPIRETSPGGIKQSSYDGASRPTCVAVRMNPAVYSSLPTDACTASTAGSNGPDRISKNVYDAAGQVTKIQRGVGSTLVQDYVTTAYTLNGKRDWLEDANGNRTDFTYDGFDRVRQVNYPQLTIGAHAANASDYDRFGYDANNNRISLRMRSGDSDTVNYTYDVLNRETLRDMPGGTATDAFSGYDLLGRRLYVRHASTSGQGITYTYDAWGGVLTEAQYGRTLSYQHDEAGNRTRITWPDTNYVEYTYDASNRMDQVRENGAASGAGLLADYAYDAIGRRASVTRGNGAITTISYDAASRPSSLVENLSGTSQDLTLGFSFLPSSQIATRSISNDGYKYAPAALNRSYTRDGLNRYTAVGGTAFSYDGRHNLINNGVRAFTYDLENHLTLVTGASGTPTQLSLAYDPRGRLRETVAGTTTLQFVSADDQLSAEYSGTSATVVRRYVHGANIDEPIVWYEGSAMSSATRRWLHADHQGSIVAATNGSAARIGSAYTYSPYGEPDTTNGWNGSRFRYTGQIALPEAQLYHYKARVYDPGLGRFLQTDPVGYDNTYNLYAYGSNDPMNNTDPRGKDAIFYVDPAGARGLGHTRLYFQDEKGNWFSYDQGARNNGSSGSRNGSSNTLGGTVDSFSSPSGSDVNGGVDINPVAADAVPSDGGAVRLKTTPAQDALIAKSAQQSQADHASGKKEYNLYSNNCTDAAVDVVNESGAGITVPNPSTVVKPNSFIEYLKDHLDEIEGVEVEADVDEPQCIRLPLINPTQICLN
jgi:RHS repeat-associated protein